MDAVAGAGGMFGQLAVGIAGGPDGATMPGFNSAVNKLGKIGQKPTIDSLPDKVRHFEFLVGLILIEISRANFVKRNLANLRAYLKVDQGK